MTRKKKSAINFDKTIFGLNITEHGVRSYSKTIKLGPLQFTANINGEHAKGSVGIPGTGISFRNILSMDLPDIESMLEPKKGKKTDMWE